MIPPKTLSAKRARRWLSEATGASPPSGAQICYVQPYIHLFTPICPEIVERYDVSNIYGEGEDDIPLAESPLAKIVNRQS
jgi:hypothetical protein